MEEPLSPGDYQKVLLYMQERNEEDFQAAVQTLRKHGFNLQTALVPIDQQVDRARLQIEMTEQELLNKFVRFLAAKRDESPGFLGYLFDNIKKLFSMIFTAFAKLFLPRSIFAKLLYPKFYSIHYPLLPIQERPLYQLLQRTKHLQRKSVMVVVTQGVVQEFVDWIKRNEIYQKVFSCFEVVGYIAGDKNLQILGQLDMQPQIILCRMNIFQEVVVINSFRRDGFAFITPEGLQTCYEKGMQIMKNDKKIEKLYRRYRRRLSGFLSESSQEQDLGRIEKDQEEINKQNEAYIALQQSEKNKIIAPLPFHIDQQELQLRKIRQLSLPPQPKEGDIIRFIFRCPNGDTLSRNFLRSQKVDLLFSWVELNDEIEFQEQGKKFEVMYSFPLKTLSPMKEKIIGEVFQEEQERVVIREV